MVGVLWPSAIWTVFTDAQEKISSDAKVDAHRAASIFSSTPPPPSR
jgi:hypothetical protein